MLVAFNCYEQHPGGEIKGNHALVAEEDIAGFLGSFEDGSVDMLDVHAVARRVAGRGHMPIPRTVGRGAFLFGLGECARVLSVRVTGGLVELYSGVLDGEGNVRGFWKELGD